MAKGVHTEETFEAEIEAHLLAHGYESASPAEYDRERALFPAIVVEFVRTTQPKVWERLEAILKERLEALLLAELEKVMDRRGSLEALRHGFSFYGQKVRLAFFEPGHRKNPELWTRYRQNRLHVVRQLRYDPHNDNELDLVLCLNGVPVVTCELKNAMTSQEAVHARNQYRKDRDPNAPIFRFKKRALVHFAVDADEAWMTTRLANVKEMLADSGLTELLKEGRLSQEQIEEELATPDQLALRKALLRGPQPNMSFFAFTATPKHKTLEMFGHRRFDEGGADGKPAPFHLYSMRQAIEEGFILDVLRGYTTSSSTS